MLIFTAGAQPVHLHPVQEKGETEGETMVPFGNKLKGLWNEKEKKLVKTTDFGLACSKPHFSIR